MPLLVEHRFDALRETYDVRVVAFQLDIITFGPKGSDVHTPNEKLDLDSFDRSYQMLKCMVSACAREE